MLAAATCVRGLSNTFCSLPDETALLGAFDLDGKDGVDRGRTLCEDPSICALGDPGNRSSPSYLAVCCTAEVCPEVPGIPLVL